MDPVLLARLQFALTIGFHYIFPPITIGMAWIIVFVKVRHLRTGDPVYATMARFWTRVFALSFAVGVATGIVMEFQFGTNWADYSRFVGDIFGAPLAAEGIFAFFLESTFLGLLLFGERRLSARMHLVSAVMVASGATLSAFWIIVANSWQQTPAGYHIVAGRAELTDFWAAVFNPSTLPRYLHTMGGAFVAGSFFVLGLSAWFLIKGRHEEFARRSMRIALVFGFVSSAAMLPLGHYHAVQVAETQPAKLAAYEGLYESRTHAPLILFGIPRPEEERIDMAVRVPSMLSVLVGLSPSTEVTGLEEFPRHERPPIALTFFSFHLMVALGMYFIAFTGLGMLLAWRRRLYGNRPFLKLALASIPLPIVANELGWIGAEVGRQPWAVYGELLTRDSISVSVPASQILLSILLFSLVYASLLACWIYILWRKLQSGPESEEKEAG